MSHREAKRHRLEQYQAMPGNELVAQISWTLKTLKRLQRELTEMRIARNRQRRKGVMR